MARERESPATMDRSGGGGRGMDARSIGALRLEADRVHKGGEAPLRAPLAIRRPPTEEAEEEERRADRQTK